MLEEEILEKGAELARVSEQIEKAKREGDLDKVQELTPLFEEGQSQFQELAKACGWRKPVTNKEEGQ